MLYEKKKKKKKKIEQKQQYHLANLKIMLLFFFYHFLLVLDGRLEFKYAMQLIFKTAAKLQIRGVIEDNSMIISLISQ